MTVKDREGDSFHFKLSLTKIDSRRLLGILYRQTFFKKFVIALLICNLRISQLHVEIHRGLIFEKIYRISRLNRL